MPGSRSQPPRSVLVVGATSGIGLALAQRLARNGVGLTLAARDPGRLDDVAARLRRDGAPTVVAVALDVVAAPEVAAAVQTALSAHGRLDAVVTTAQAMAYGDVDEVPAEVVRAVTDTAVLGVANLAAAALPVFRRQGGGRLVVVGSLLGEIPVPSMGVYCAAKAAQHALVRTLQVETGGTAGVEVSLVVPGAVDTPIYRAAGSYAGRQGAAPPPVVPADKVAAACERVLTTGAGRVHVGVLNRPAIAASRALPGLYARLARVLVPRVVLRGPPVPPGPGNTLAPQPSPARVSDGWGRWGRRRER